MQCDYYDAALCRSCTLLEQPYDDQLARKVAGARAALGEGVRWELPVASAESGFRNKAKMVVAGTVEAPTLGILDGARGVDLRGCALHTPGITAALPVLAAFVTEASLTPYDVATRRGELKHVLVTDSGTALMVRFVLRSTEALARIRKHLPPLVAELGDRTVVSVNVQPEHKAVLEGEREIVLTEAGTLRMPVGDVTLHLRPQSFFQTNTAVAGALYRDAAAWVDELAVRTAWDLYCGVGGFALHLAPGRDVLGVELSGEAVASALTSRDELGLTARFQAGDAAAFVRDVEAVPDLVVVNPPRRGLGELAGLLEASGVAHVLYSSCHVGSLGRDLRAMPSLRPVKARVYDMFPHTEHHETLVMLQR
ncbi:23S rRNA (uracil(747)-C(5))-methyltransferase RlmC [Actinotalea sp. M2MS4P-6]|uniref:23S rRNA (uracil(747)-C(5))-methyltransferase RlmC n=1 Tax=Actinotalea sp. M2MS4P-6 TaxID=2983762 RepID=UPI0021E3CC7F|nr:23S rRNA (uracil(747)-C(5))-methyltransferase RlmC [Actinotalea sp. M2MS4P-6]MCV2393613.1 23S rRNA (uracil(747)-C(5))-methyltransferase RlmC [Actinotalea sp. M2MS4P-6]